MLKLILSIYEFVVKLLEVYVDFYWEVLIVFNYDCDWVFGIIEGIWYWVDSNWIFISNN